MHKTHINVKHYPDYLHTIQEASMCINQPVCMLPYTIRMYTFLNIALRLCVLTGQYETYSVHSATSVYMCMFTISLTLATTGRYLLNQRATFDCKPLFTSTHSFLLLMQIC